MSNSSRGTVADTESRIALFHPAACGIREDATRWPGLGSEELSHRIAATNKQGSRAEVCLLLFLFLIPTYTLNPLNLREWSLLFTGLHSCFAFCFLFIERARLYLVDERLPDSR